MPLALILVKRAALKTLKNLKSLANVKIFAGGFPLFSMISEISRSEGQASVGE